MIIIDYPDWHNIFYYDETSYTYLRWKIERRCGRKYAHILARVGDAAGSLYTKGYYQVEINHKAYLVHRIIWELFNPKIPDREEIDHFDRNRKNNNINNLRMGKDLNHSNMPKRNDNQSGVTGVSLYTYNLTDSWQARWTEFLTGKEKSKYFSIKDLGNDLAFRLACQHRTKMIKEQNLLGANYSPTHGLANPAHRVNDEVEPSIGELL